MRRPPICSAQVVERVPDWAPAWAALARGAALERRDRPIARRAVGAAAAGARSRRTALGAGLHLARLEAGPPDAMPAAYVAGAVRRLRAPLRAALVGTLALSRAGASSRRRSDRAAHRACRFSTSPRPRLRHRPDGPRAPRRGAEASTASTFRRAWSAQARGPAPTTGSRHRPPRRALGRAAAAALRPDRGGRRARLCRRPRAGCSSGVARALAPGRALRLHAQLEAGDRSGRARRRPAVRPFRVATWRTPSQGRAATVRTDAGARADGTRRRCRRWVEQDVAVPDASSRWPVRRARCWDGRLLDIRGRPARLVPAAAADLRRLVRPRGAGRRAPTSSHCWPMPSAGAARC